MFIFSMFMSIFVPSVPFAVSLNVGRIVDGVAVGVTPTRDCGRVGNVGPDVLRDFYLQSNGRVGGSRSPDIAARTCLRASASGPSHATRGKSPPRVWPA